RAVSRSHLHSFPTRRSSDLGTTVHALWPRRSTVVSAESSALRRGLGTAPWSRVPLLASLWLSGHNHSHGGPGTAPPTTVTPASGASAAGARPPRPGRCDPRRWGLLANLASRPAGAPAAASPANSASRPGQRGLAPR